jgi:hypothetical protein
LVDQIADDLLADFELISDFLDKAPFPNSSDRRHERKSIVRARLRLCVVGLLDLAGRGVVPEDRVDGVSEISLDFGFSRVIFSTDTLPAFGSNGPVDHELVCRLDDEDAPRPV